MLKKRITINNNHENSSKNFTLPELGCKCSPESVSLIFTNKADNQHHIVKSHRKTNKVNGIVTQKQNMWKKQHTCNRSGSISLKVRSSWHRDKIRWSRRRLQRTAPPTMSVTYNHLQGRQEFSQHNQQKTQLSKGKTKGVKMWMTQIYHT